MSDRRLPYFPVWLDDLFGSHAVRMLGQDPALLGGYLLLLFAQWSAPECSLPADERELRKLSWLPPRAWKRLWSVVGSSFVPRTDGRLQHPRVEQERSRALDISEKRAESGRKGAAARWQTDGKRHGKRMANRCHPSPSTSTTTPTTAAAPSGGKAAARSDSTRHTGDAAAPAQPPEGAAGATAASADDDCASAPASHAGGPGRAVAPTATDAVPRPNGAARRGVACPRCKRVSGVVRKRVDVRRCEAHPGSAVEWTDEAQCPACGWHGRKPGGKPCLQCAAAEVGS